MNVLLLPKHLNWAASFCNVPDVASSSDSDAPTDQGIDTKGSAPASDQSTPGLADGADDAVSSSLADMLQQLSDPVWLRAPPGAGSGAPPPADFAKDVDKVVKALDDFKKRNDAIVVTYEMEAVNAPYRAAIKTFSNATKAGLRKQDLSAAVAAIPAADTALKAVEAEAAKQARDLPERKKAAAAAADKIDKMSDDDLRKLSNVDKAGLVKQILRAGKPTNKPRDAQKKLYRDTPIDPDFDKDDKARQDKVAADLKDDKELSDARGKWGSLDKDGLRKALGKIVAAQCKEYGIPVTPIVFFPDEEEGVTSTAGVVAGFYDPDDGKLHMNMDPASGIKDFTETITTVLHENMHHYQDELVKMLRSGKLDSKDPRYKQALIFEVNELQPGGYIPGDEGVADYQAQPLERAAEGTGVSTAKKVSTNVKPPAPP